MTAKVDAKRLFQITPARGTVIKPPEVFHHQGKRLQNTYLYNISGQSGTQITVLRYYETDIAEFHHYEIKSEEYVRLTLQGHYTKSTLDRINKGLNHFGYRQKLVRRNRKLVVLEDDVQIPYHEGMYLWK